MFIIYVLPKLVFIQASKRCEEFLRNKMSGFSFGNLGGGGAGNPTAPAGGFSFGAAKTTTASTTPSTGGFAFGAAPAMQGMVYIPESLKQYFNWLFRFRSFSHPALFFKRTR